MFKVLLKTYKMDLRMDFFQERNFKIILDINIFLHIFINIYINSF
jgi:hypothetical protein